MHGLKESRIVWATRKLGTVMYAWVCVYVPVNVTNGSGREMRKIRSDVKEYFRKIGEGWC